MQHNIKAFLKRRQDIIFLKERKRERKTEREREREREREEHDTSIDKIDLEQAI